MAKLASNVLYALVISAVSGSCPVTVEKPVHGVTDGHHRET
jgi:hypothetical protein